MLIEVKWRKDRIVSKIRQHEVWQFWSSDFRFSCSLSSIHKKRRPERIFLAFSVYRSKNNYKYNQEEGRFTVEKEIVYNKIKP